MRVSVFRLRHLAAARMAQQARRVPALRPYFVRQFAADLRALNDALAETDLDGHYWVWGGLLLGWAREGAILPHDSADADFGVADRDFHRLVSAVPALTRAGFKCDRCFVNHKGEITELTFMRHGARFEFFRLFSESGSVRCYGYSIKWKETTQFEETLPEQEKVPFTFLGRTWLKSADHALELRTMYGSWEIPDPSWSYLGLRTIESRRPSRYRDFDWRGGAEELAAIADTLPLRSRGLSAR